MDRPKWEVADVFRRYGETYRNNHGASMSTAQRRVMTAIEVCRTAALGGHLERCDQCGQERNCFNSCRDRHCPKCQSLARAKWIEDRQAELLEVGYFHVVLPYRKRSPTSLTKIKNWSWASSSGSPPKHCEPLRRIRNISGRRSASLPSCTVGGRTSSSTRTSNASFLGVGCRPTVNAGSPAGDRTSFCRSACYRVFFGVSFWKRYRQPLIPAN